MKWCLGCVWRDTDNHESGWCWLFGTAVWTSNILDFCCCSLPPLCCVCEDKNGLRVCTPCVTYQEVHKNNGGVDCCSCWYVTEPGILVCTPCGCYTKGRRDTFAISMDENHHTHHETLNSCCLFYERTYTPGTTTTGAGKDDANPKTWG